MKKIKVGLVSDKATNNMDLNLDDSGKFDYNKLILKELYIINFLI